MSFSVILFIFSLLCHAVYKLFINDTHRTELRNMYSNMAFQMSKHSVSMNDVQNVYVNIIKYLGIFCSFSFFGSEQFFNYKSSVLIAKMCSPQNKNNSKLH